MNQLNKKNNIKPKLIRITTIPGSLYKLLDGQLKFMSEFYEVVGVSSSGDFLEKVELQEGVRIKAIEMTREITLGSDIKSLWQMYLYLHKEKPLIVHTHTPKAGIVGMMAAWLARVPIRLHTVAGLPLMEAKGVKRRLLNFVEKTTYFFSTKVYPNSYGLKDFIISENLCCQNKLKVIGSGSSNGINTSYFNPVLLIDDEKNLLRNTLHIDKTDFVYISVGRLVKDKGINELVAAFNELNLKDCKLLLVGQYEKELDPLLPETEQIIDDNPDIISLGYKDDVRPYMAISNCLVFPSYREGFPNVVMQAGSMGLPSIVTNINGCNEIIKESQNGLIIPSKNKEALQKAMQYCLTNKEHLTRMANNARALITSRYEQKDIWEAILAEYKYFEEKHSNNK